MLQAADQRSSNPSVQSTAPSSPPLMDSLALASRLQITAMAVRQHLYALQKERLATYQEEQRAIGRPAKLWYLTPDADCFFSDGHAELSLSLIHSIVEVFGEAGLERLLELRSRQGIAAYQSQVPDDGSLQERLEALAKLRTNEGYMAEVQPLENDSFLLIENHCPICAAATICTGLCRKELEVFQTVLGNDVTVERTEHIVEGSLRCAYKVSA